MRTQPMTFRKKAAEVQAMIWDGTAQGATPIIEWLLSVGVTAKYVCSDIQRCAENDGDAPHWIKVDAPGQQLFVHVGEWLVRNEVERFERHSYIAFEAAYELVTPDSRPNVSEGGEVRG